MIIEEVQFVIGGLFGCWVIGYAAGYLQKVITQASEKI